VKVRRAPKPTKTKAPSVQPVPPVEKWKKAQSKKSKKSPAVPESLPNCIECGEAVYADVKALQREMCSEEVWKCAQCLGLDDEMYEFLASSTDHGLHWFCDKCEEIIVDGIGLLSNKLLSSLHKLMEKSDLIEQKICDVMVNVEQKMNDTATKLEKSMEDKVKAVESGVAHLIGEEIIVDGIGLLSNKLLSSLHKLMEKSDLIEQKICDVMVNVEQKMNDTATKLEKSMEDKVKAVSPISSHSSRVVMRHEYVQLRHRLNRVLWMWAWYRS